MDYEIVRSNFYDAYRHAKYGDMRMIPHLKTYYEEGVKNPSVTKIIQQAVMDRKIKADLKQMAEDSVFLRGEANANFKKAISEIAKGIFNINIQSTCNNEVKPLYLAFEEEFKKRYPKTGRIRMRLINYGRFSTDKIALKMEAEAKKKLLGFLRFFK